LWHLGILLTKKEETDKIEEQPKNWLMRETKEF
jgi:hypothetical protein